MGFVYLIRFETKLSNHAQYYLGYAEHDSLQRLKRHREGNGAKILRACNERGIHYYIVRLWFNVDRNFERKLKSRKNNSSLCPVMNKHLRHFLSIID